MSGANHLRIYQMIMFDKYTDATEFTTPPTVLSNAPPNMSNALTEASSISNSNMSLAEERGYPPLTSAIVITMGSILIIMITSGNLLVITAVIKDRKLYRMRQNWLIVSLAFADLLVGALIMPLSLAYEVLGEWTMGLWLCEIWLALDVLFVTSSILNLCVISLDRYWSITDPLNYPNKRTPRRMSFLVAISWIIAFAISFPPLVGWRPKNRRPGDCTLSTDVGYVLYSASGSFYIPVTVLILVYIQIYKISKERSSQKIKEIIQKEAQLSKISGPRSPNVSMKELKKNGKGPAPHLVLSASKGSYIHNNEGDPAYAPLTDPEGTTTHGSDEADVDLDEEGYEEEEDESGVFSSPEQSQNFEYGTPSFSGVSLSTISRLSPHHSPSLPHCGPQYERGPPHRNNTYANGSLNRSDARAVFQGKDIHLRISKKKPINRGQSRKYARQSVFNPQKQLYLRLKLLKKKERRATIILGLILTSFVACWFPFFITYVLGAAGIPAPEVAFDVFFWLGYCNSAVNPLIYTVFNTEFREAFIRLLKGSSNRRNTF